MTSFSPEVLTLFKLLDDGEWHDYKQISEELAATMAPGKALRRYESRREGRRSRGEVRQTAVEPTDDEKILYGQRLLTSVAINGVKSRYLDFSDGEGGRVVRLRPGAPVPTPQRAPEGLLRPSKHDSVDEEGGGLSPSPRSFHGFTVEMQRELDAVIDIPTWGLKDEETFEVVPESVPEPEPEPEPEYPTDILPKHILPAPSLEATREQTRAVTAPYACRPCGLFVTDRAAHDEFHRTHQAVADPETVTAPQPPRDEAAVFSEKDVREIVAQEVGRALDRFQAGMQTWLGERFAGMERRLGPVRLAKPKKPNQPGG